MSYDHISYHRQREQQCREMAESASDPHIRRRHEQLANLHATRAEGFHFSQAMATPLA